MTAFDHVTQAAAFGGPGIDPRQWVSFGTVDRDAPGARSVNFTREYGPLVNVTLHPSGTPVVCRVAHHVAGNGEGEWFPFIEGDEVLVAIPEGSEDAGCTIIGRLNQEIDQWPQRVAGEDSTTNTFAFRRLRTPYVVETASAYQIRSAVTGASIGISQDGSVQLVSGDKAFVAIRPDFVGMQSGDATVLVQIDVAHQEVVLEAAGARLTIGQPTTSLYTSGTVQIGTSGNNASEHATSIESVVAVLVALFTAVGTHTPGPLTGASLAAAVAAVMADPSPAGVLVPAAGLPYAPFLAALAAALQVAKIPGITAGCAAPGLTI